MVDIEEIDINELLENHSLTIFELAKKVRLSPRTIYRFRSGKAVPKPHVKLLFELVYKGVI